MQDTDVERFFLYGEPARPAGARFAHLELLDDRSRPANWIIRPHAHLDLHHIFVVESGGGAAETPAGVIQYTAPCIVVVPSGVVHGFRWIEDTDGRVLTFSDAFLQAIALKEERLAALFERGVWTAPAGGAALADALSRLARELSWAAPAHELAVETQLAAVLIEALRMRRHVEQEAPLDGRAVLVARFRQLIEQHFREHLSVEAYADRLGVAPARLRAACRTAAGASPTRLVQDRVLLEGERLMRYTNMSVTQIALYLGFTDPAYFSRFFAAKAGASPRAVRNAARAV